MYCNLPSALRAEIIPARVNCRQVQITWYTALIKIDKELVFAHCFNINRGALLQSLFSVSSRCFSCNLPEYYRKIFGIRISAQFSHLKNWYCTILQ